MAQTILDGGRPYLDAWDHKPPMVYLFDALGLFLSHPQGGTSWGVWSLEFTIWTANLLPLFYVVKRLRGVRSASVFLGFVLLEIPFYLQGGNQPTEWALISMGPVLALLFYPGLGLWKFLPIGFLCGLGFLCKPNCVSTLLASLFVAVFVLTSWDKFKAALFLAMGFLFPVSLCWFWLESMGAGKAALDAVFHYNVIYSAAVPMPVRFLSSIGITLTLLKTGVGAIGFLSFLFLAIRSAVKRAFMRNWVQTALCLATALEFASICATGRGNPHYLIYLLPLLGLSSALLVSSWKLPAWFDRLLSPPVVSAVCALTLFTGTCLQADPKLDAEKQSLLSANIIFRHLLPGEKYFMIWGAESGVYFGTPKRSPTRYMFSYPLIARGYLNDSEREEFEAEVISKKPAIILDVSTVDRISPPLDPSRSGPESDLAEFDRKLYRPAWEPEKLREFLKDGYRFIGKIEPAGWPLYARIRQH
jgi:hypothetical protein